jgi:hypothetical protein
MQHSFLFNQLGRADNSPVDNSQKNLSNSKFANYTLSNFSNSASDHHLKFATSQPVLIPNGLTFGNGLNGSVVDSDSILLLKSTQERSFEKLQLLQRPFSTVPYLGKGFSNPFLESQLLMGEISRDKPSVNTVTEQSFLNYSLYPTDHNMIDHVTNSAYVIESDNDKNWVRGGVDTRF